MSMPRALPVAVRRRGVRECSGALEPASPGRSEPLPGRRQRRCSPLKPAPTPAMAGTERAPTATGGTTFIMDDVAARSPALQRKEALFVDAWAEWCPHVPQHAALRVRRAVG